MTAKTVATLVAGALAVGLTAAAGAADIKWRLGSPVGPQDLLTTYLVDYGKRVTSRTGGRMTFEVIPIETINFKNVDTLRVVRQGVVDAIYLQPFYVTRDEPLMSAFMPHGVLTDPAENLRVIDVQYKIAQEIMRDKWRVEMITNDPTGGGQSRLYITSKTPINTLDELRKKKLRHYSRTGIRAYAKLGVSAQIIPSSDLYLALQTGVVDAAEYGAPYILSQSINEVTCCAAYVGALTLSPRGVIVEGSKWAALSEEFRKAMIAVGDEMYAESMEIWKKDSLEQEAVDKLVKSGYRVLEPFPIADRLKIQAAILEVWHEDVTAIGPNAVAMYDRIVAALKPRN